MRGTALLFQLVHVPNFGTCVQALTLLYQLYSTKMSLSDRPTGRCTLCSARIL